MFSLNGAYVIHVVIYGYHGVYDGISVYIYSNNRMYGCFKEKSAHIIYVRIFKEFITAICIYSIFYISHVLHYF